MSSSAHRAAPVSPRAERSRTAILGATMRLLDGGGVAGPLEIRTLTIENVAREAGVSKTTIYRWWSNKIALVIDALLAHKVWHLPLHEELPALEAIDAHLVALVESYADSRGRLVAQLIAECQYDAEASDELKTRFWDERSAALMTLIDRAVTEGVLDRDTDPERFADLLYSPVYYRLLLRTGPMDRAFARGVLAEAVRGKGRDAAGATGREAP